MSNKHSFPQAYSQNKELPVRIVSPAFGHITPENETAEGHTRRLSYYFFLFVTEGVACHNVDLETFHVGQHEILFGLPHQIQQMPEALHGNDYFKLGFDDACLSRLPRHYPFLLDPYHRQKISCTPQAAMRLQAIFSLLQELLRNFETDPELILAHLNSLMTEINAAYFAGARKDADGDRLDQFAGFKMFVEQHLTDQPAIKDIAAALAISTDRLYEIVKHHSGLSPKEYMTQRLILEAKRRLYYGKQSSVKELAFELGFNDPDYFSRLFKKMTGKTIAAFSRDMS